MSAEYYSYMYHYGLLFVHHYRLVSHHQFIYLYLEGPPALSLVIHNHPMGCIPFCARNFQAMLRTDVPVYYASHLFMVFWLYIDFEHLAVMCWIVSGASLHSLHFGSWLLWWTLASIDLALRAHSCTGIIRASVLSFSPVLSSHW